MIVSFVFTMDPIHENLSQTWVFYKAISFALKNHGAVIAQEHYFNGWDKQKKLFPQFFFIQQVWFFCRKYKLCLQKCKIAGC